MPGRARRVPAVLETLGLLFLAVSAAVLIAGGVQAQVEPLRISATSPARLLFEGAVIILGGVILRGLPATRTIGAIALVLVAAACDSQTRRVGDGFEYFAMARNLARAERPSVTEAQMRALASETAALGDDSWAVDEPLPSLRGADGRHDFPHFWMYSLSAAPLVAAAGLAGWHPAAGFTLLHVIVLTTVTVLLVRRGAAAVAILFASLMLWWMDKAHAEPFIAGLCAMALLVQDDAPGTALLLLGVVAAQMPLMAPLLAIVLLLMAPRFRSDRRLAACGAGALAIAALHPLYYLWRLGVLTPLAGTLVAHRPPLRALITPLVDPNLGIVWFAPALVLLIVGGVVGAVRGRRFRDVAAGVTAAAVILWFGSQTPNVNHGGTPRMSRYGVWTVAVLLPLAAAIVPTAVCTWKRASTAALLLSVAFAAVVLHPRRPDSGSGSSPTRLASLLWTRAPRLDNPLPEVFAERIGHGDGPVVVPVATAGCEKALIVGTGTRAIWPAHCGEHAVPAVCAGQGVYCYANRFVAVPAPRQPGFTPRVARTGAER